jgi:FkbM family methyltransferase
VHWDEASNGWIHDASGAGILVLAEPRGPGVRGHDQLAREVFLHRFNPEVGHVILDIGAGVGTEVVTFARMVGETGRVIAFEAHPATCALLRRTVQLNGLSQVEVVQAAVMDSEIPVTMSDLGPTLTHVNRVGGQGVSVQAVTLQRVLHDHGIGQVDFIKMNIEGAELAALRGLGDELTKVRHVAIGCHDFLADETGDESYRTKEEVRALLLAAGFAVVGRDYDPRPWARDYIYGWR